MTPAEVLKALRSIPSMSVLEVGANHGCPRYLVGYRSGEQSVNILVEVKEKAAQLSEAQMKFREEWKGPIITVTDINNIVKYLRRITEPRNSIPK